MTDNFDDVGKLVWACTCHAGGTASARGTEPASVFLERDVAAHLAARGNERHRVDVGRYFTSAVLNPAPKPLIWGED